MRALTAFATTSATALLASSLLSSCISFDWRKDNVFTPLAESAVASLVPGTSTLEDALAALGAPLYVWEGSRGRAVLAYGAQETELRGFKISAQVVRNGSASFSYDDVESSLEGVVLVFDAQWTLEIVRRGTLRELHREHGRVRPANVEAQVASDAAR